ncbi:Pyrethroid hydrolase [Tsuneonella dongtanensis]|uniref:Pyrethroid hydrolase n=1 Tax=Tsuneonella dongtanensis TaxID=692370 RepID=A0A1B2ABU6_9SPHN|nr:alpha/beta fold hydrolase [Tsuneonella dongtanensis]ANY19581.1 Pyrethroid hydrolase [Tsuneonella dongtanensis]
MAGQHFVLVHGSWHDGGAWDAVSDALRAAGHAANAPTLPGHGPAADRDVGFADYVAAVVAAVRRCGAARVVLVGHSLGGAVVAAAAEQVADALERLVFVAPIVPADGERLIDVIPPESAKIFAAMAAASPDNSLEMPWPVWRERFVGEADLTLAEETFARLCPEPFRPVSEPVAMPGFAALEVPRSYVDCRTDVAFPPGEWHFFPRFFDRLGLCRLIAVEAGHEAMFTAPAALARALIDAARA